MAAGLYVHFPFCARKCDYCSFYSAPPAEGEIDNYITALLCEAKLYAARYSDAVFDSLYIGGGTPSLMNGAQASRLFSGLKEVLAFDGNTEFTTEANPESLTDGYLRAFAGHGGNRLSIGVQSLCDAECAAVGRITDSQKVFSAIEAAKTFQINNISCDLLLGLPGQTVSSLSAGIKALVSANVTHLSLYSLKVESGTPLFARKDSLVFPGDDNEFLLYREASALLASLGLKRYEISNFAREGFESRHNRKYWRLDDYLGLGPSAHSFFNGKRFFNPSDTSAYISGTFSPLNEDVGLFPSGSAGEKLMLALRTSDGIPLTFFPESRRKDAQNYLQKLISAGYAVETNGSAVLTDSGLWVMNPIILGFSAFSNDI